jgi:hypothetical protein
MFTTHIYTLNTIIIIIIIIKIIIIIIIIVINIFYESVVFESF